MKKQLLIIGITLVLITVGLSGCTDNNLSSKSNDQKILGRWTGTQPSTPEIAIFNFYTNGSLYMGVNEQFIWLTYAMTDETLVLQSKGETRSLEYSFSNNDNKLTLIEVGGGEYAVLTRQ
jgi:hypothetical protein